MKAIQVLIMSVMITSASFAQSGIEVGNITKTVAKLVGTSHVEQYVQVSVGLNNEAGYYHVISLSGEVMLHGSFDQYQAEGLAIDVSNVPTGIYFLQIFEKEAKPAVVKFVKV